MYTYSEVVARVRNKLLEYFGKLVEVIPGGRQIDTGLFVTGVSASCTRVPSTGFSRVGVVDGGSGVMALNVGYVGVVSAVGIIIEANRVVERIVAEPSVIPENPADLVQFESPSAVESIVDKVREALVFETAKRIAERGVDLLVVDGPVVPYGALAKKPLGLHEEEVAWLRYRSAVLELHKYATRRGVNLVGFVKRPRSKYIARLQNVSGFDHVVLSSVLKPGEYYPEPPLGLADHLHLFHEPEVAEIVGELKPRITYLKLTDSTPPSRVDFGHLAVDYRAVLSYFYATRTREGVPYVIMKADEEAKITKKLIRELYDDVLHEYIVRYVKNRPDMLVPLLPEYGGL